MLQQEENGGGAAPGQGGSLEWSINVDPLRERAIQHVSDAGEL